MTYSNGTKKSKFPALTTLPADATLDFVSAGANYKITSSDFVDAMGTTGTLVSDGGVSDFDILDDQGSVKAIRKLSAGTGISLNITADNAVALNQNFTFDATGAELVDNPAASTLAFRSIVGENGLTITDSDGVITLKNAAPFFTNSIVISTLTDLPDPVLTVITLADNTLYLIDGDINLGVNTLVLGTNTVLMGQGEGVSSITSSASGNLLTATTSFAIYDIEIVAPSATIFNCTGSASETAVVEHVTITSASDLGAFNTWHSCIFEFVTITTTTTGLHFTGACGEVLMHIVNFNAGYDVAIDLNSATFDSVNINTCNFENASATSHINIAASSANINANKIGRFTDLNFDSGATNIVNNFDTGNIRWESHNNLNLTETNRNAQMYMHTQQTTTISTGSGDTGNPIKINAGTSWVSAHSDQFTVNTNGRLTYVGETETEFLIDCKIAGTVAAGTSNFSFYLAKNGSIITASKSLAEFTSTAISNPPSTAAIVSLQTDDYIELFVENTTDEDNWVSEVLNMYIGRV